MKKIIAVLICLSTVLVLFGCGKKDETKDLPDNVTTTVLSGDFSNISVEKPEINTELETVARANEKGGKDVYYNVENDPSKYDSIVKYDKDGNVTEYDVFTYYEDGKNQTVRRFDGEGNFISATSYEFDENGLRTHIYYYNADGSLSYYEEDIYDKDGNLIAAPLIDTEGRTLAKGERPETTKKSETTTKKGETTTKKGETTTKKGETTTKKGETTTKKTETSTSKPVSTTIVKASETTKGAQ
ncbi:MAG: hypothetical protein II702_09155 [Clostridia bacterium]|nr:hypothetical protein [Clostridia bacterium]